MVKRTEEISIPGLRLKRTTLNIVGETPLICHKWSEKAKKEILDKQMKKAKQGREAKNPEQDFLDSLYNMPNGGYGFPAIAFKNAAVTACTSIDGMTKVAARQAFRIGATLAGSELVQILGDKPTPREDMVKVGMGTSDIHFRGEFKRWYAKLPITYNEAAISAEQVINLFNTAGFGVGVGEWRPERNGQMGCFRVATPEENKLIEKGKLFA